MFVNNAIDNFNANLRKNNIDLLMVVDIWPDTVKQLEGLFNRIWSNSSQQLLNYLTG